MSSLSISPEIIALAIDSCNDGVLITDPRQEDNPIIYCNTTITKMTGYSKEEIIGKNCRFLQGGDREQPERLTIKKAIEQGNPITVTIRNYKKDGTPFWNELSISPVKNEANELTHFIGIQKDVTRRKEAENAVQKLNDLMTGREIRMTELKQALAECKKQLL